MSNQAQPVPIERLVASYLPPVPGIDPRCLASIENSARAVFRDAMLRRAPSVKPGGEMEKALLRNVWDAASALLAEGWRNPRVPDPVVDPVLRLSGAPDLVAENPSGRTARFFVECAFRPFEGQSAPCMLYPIHTKPAHALDRASLRAGLLDSIYSRVSPELSFPCHAVVVSPDSNAVFNIDPDCIHALHAILQSAISIPGKRPNA